MKRTNNKIATGLLTAVCILGLAACGEDYGPADVDTGDIDWFTVVDPFNQTEHRCFAIDGYNSGALYCYKVDK